MKCVGQQKKEVLEMSRQLHELMLLLFMELCQSDCQGFSWDDNEWDDCGVLYLSRGRYF